MSATNTAAVLIYPSGIIRWASPCNVRLHGTKLNGERPVAIHLLNPCQDRKMSAHNRVAVGGLVTEAYGEH